MDRRVDPDHWVAPSLPERAADPRYGALGGARYDHPDHAADRDAVRAFLETPGPVCFEIGFDHGNVLIDAARRWPDHRWLGCEIRRHRVDAAAPHAPANAQLVRGDGRVLLADLIPPGRLSTLLLLFPTPSHDPRHLLLTPAVLAVAARALAPDGVLHLATDVPGMARWAEHCLTDWPVAPALPFDLAPSRRARVCLRDGRPVWRFTRHPPPTPPVDG
jgi:tRNA G46 methylase TrmB